jgi:hypothetical protein
VRHVYTRRRKSAWSVLRGPPTFGMTRGMV